MNYTKGEWKVLNEGEVGKTPSRVWVVGEDRLAIATIADRNERAANAYLIAAAPEMYKALKAFDEYVSTNYPANIRLKQIAVELMEQALYKAEGEA